MAFTLRARGPFSLDAAGEFAEGFPATEARRARGGFALAFPVDGDWRTVAVRLRERGAADGEAGGGERGAEVHGDVLAADGAGVDPALEARVRAEIEAILSLDVDGSGFPAVGARDPVVARLQARLPGLRPVLFWSPYEAAAWAVIGQRVQMAQAARVKQRLAEELGVGTEVDGVQLSAFPAPERLAALPAGQRGLNARKEEQLRALGRAALEGALDRGRLRALGPEAAAEALRELPGIGPFSAELIRIRGVGDPDALPAHERRVAAIVREEYGLPEDAPPDALERIAEGWRPYRAWVALLLRASRR